MMINEIIDYLQKKIHDYLQKNIHELLYRVIIAAIIYKSHSLVTSDKNAIREVKNVL